MARFDVYLTKRGYLLDVQADLLEGIRTRIVVPLLPKGRSPEAARQLNPMFEIDGVKLRMFTQLIAAIPKSELGSRRASLGHEADTITRALDIVLQGF